VKLHIKRPNLRSNATLPARPADADDSLRDPIDRFWHAIRFL
jgi:hypothetical protein